MKRSVLFTAMSLCLVMVISCRHVAPDQKGDLILATKGADLKEYAFASYEDDAKTTASFTNRGVRDGITLKNDGAVTLKYETVRDKRKNSVTTRRTTMVRKDRTLTFVITDLGSGQIVDQQAVVIPYSVGGTGGTGGTSNFPLCSSAVPDYLCRQQPVLQCEANRTCHIQRGGYECCETPGQSCIAVDTIVVPTDPRCSVAYVPVDRLLLR
ncbi:MAG TPA: hypothetical protein VGR02_03375 [Thermoanaerobaculia bacterium]|jgi:hypothetical protein|nr:hypothetical protein [Thermoanaerobaculia bacterium]